MTAPQSGSRYHVRSRIGSGGYGAVYRAVMTTEGGLEREVALKVLHPSLASPGEIARLRDEARLLTLLNHRAIVQVVDLVQLPIGWTVVMELVEGLDLAQVGRRITFPPRAAIEVVGEVASALHEAWTTDRGQGPLHLVHRDIKPANLKLSHKGDVKVLDFGIAAAGQFEREAKTATGEVIGTFRYMAPERFEGRAGPESDVFSLGVVLADLLGQRPKGPVHDGRHFDQIVRGVRHVAGAEVAALLEAMLAYDPDTRPSALQVAKECRQLVARLPGPALADWAMDLVPELTEEVPRSEIDAEDDPLVGTTLTATRTFALPEVRRGPSPVLVGAIALGGLAAVGAAFVLGSIVTGSAMWVGTTTEPPKPLTVARMTQLEDVPDDAAGLSMSADGTTLAYASNGDVFVHPIGGRRTNLTDALGPDASSPVLAPDGSRIAFAVKGGQLQIRSIDGVLERTVATAALPVDWDDALLLLEPGPPSVLWKLGNGDPKRFATGSGWRSARWSPDGRVLVAGKGGLEWLGADGASEPLGLDAWTADVSWDGQSVLFSDWDGKESRLHLSDEGGEPRQATHLDGRIDEIAAARRAPRAAVSDWIRTARFRRLEVAAKRKKVLDVRLLPLPPDLLVAGLMPDGDGLMWIETNENRSPGTRDILWDETFWLTTLDGEKIRPIVRIESVSADTAGMTADHLVQYMFQERPDGTARIVAVDMLEAGEPRMVVEMAPDLHSSIWVSPDGRRVSLTDHDGRMYVLPTDRPIRALPPNDGPEGWRTLGWTLDETGVLALHEDGRLVVFDAETLAVTELATGVEDAASVPEDLLILQRPHALSWFSPAKGKEWPLVEVESDRFVFEPTPDGQYVLVTEIKAQRDTWVADLER